MKWELEKNITDEGDVQFRDLPGFEGKYSAGSDGFIYSTYKSEKPFRLKVKIGTNGYLYSKIQKDGKIYCRSTHVWVCLAFHGEKPTPKHQVRHLDGNKTNNTPENLQWGTRSENMQDRRLHGTFIEGEKHGSAKFTNEEVANIRYLFDSGEIKSAQLRKIYSDVKKCTIYNIIYRRTYKNV